MPIFSLTAKPDHKALKTKENFASFLDHTLLKADASSEDIRKLCEEATAHRFASVCVNGRFVKDAVRWLTGSGVKTVAVIGFPLGAMATKAKAYEAAEAIRDGAEEIDMVLAIGALKSGQDELVAADIRAVVEASKPHPVKVILETALLDDRQKTKACELAKAAGAAFVKTSTGFGPGGATVEDVTLMRKTVGSQMGVKASGGIRCYEDAKKMIDAGANRLGTSASVAIVEHAARSKETSEY